MTRSEIATLTRRVDSQDETLRAVADTVVDVRDIVDGHTGTLAEHTRLHEQHTATLAEHTATLAEHTRLHEQHAATLAEHTATLAEHTGMLREILRRLPPPS
ncbi:hypothetical protein [Pseudonocardia sp. NPDC046786]|uniref:hypothetical protein n=1 Tax=Pseudonocardia sp. NPDC046786 TaxID=3155471 RepID=UPI0033C60E45